jgi:hypothetical protein
MVNSLMANGGSGGFMAKEMVDARQAEAEVMRMR